jgi:MoxR-like ATPase
LKVSQASAFLNGRDFVLPEDIKKFAKNVICHRMILSYEALSDEITAEEILEKILNKIPVV